jgi:hypothetical protein
MEQIEETISRLLHLYNSCLDYAHQTDDPVEYQRSQGEMDHILIDIKRLREIQAIKVCENKDEKKNPRKKI